MRHSGTTLRRRAKGICMAAAPALLIAALLTACGGGRSSANSQVPVQSSGNPVDQIIAEKAGGTGAPADDTGKPEGTAAAEETSASDPWLQEDYVYEPPENMSHDGIDVDLTYVDVDGIEYCRLLDAVMGTDEAGKG